MCGIAGILRFDNQQVLAETIEAMTSQLTHRGPDGCGCSVDGAIGLGHRRLSIIDLSPAGRQPMSYRYGNKIVVFNGEIYNYRELRKELENFGYLFSTNTDTEVLINAYAAWGQKCLDKFCGMFAFAIWDRDNKTLFLARDRLGKKPLHIFRFPGGIAFSSELKGFYPLPEFNKRINNESLHYYFSLRYIPAPYTIWEHCEKVRPAHWVRIAVNGSESSECYWYPKPSAENRNFLSPAEADVHIHDALRLAVHQRMISDVPLGAFLSGGIDSSLVVALMAEMS